MMMPPLRLCPLLVLVAAIACGAPNPAAPVPRPPSSTGDPTRRYELEQVYLLEMEGVPPDDTTLYVTPGTRRVVVLRHGPPDNLVFADLTLPALPRDTTRPAADSVRLAVRPRPGVYGLDVQIGSLALPAGTAVTFEYPVHFSAPEDARRRYGSDEAFESALAVGQLLPDGGIRFLVSTRPTADNLRAELPEPGSYVVGAPK
jgi:hypothetical protein